MPSSLSVLLITLFIVALLATVGIIIGRFVRLYSACPHCGSKRIAGKTVCPFCKRPYNQPRRQSIASTPSPPAPSASSPPPYQPSPAQTSYETQPPPPVSLDLLGPRLECIEGPAAGKVFPLDVETKTIGRAPDNSIVVEGMLASRYHAQIEKRGAQYVLIDRNSTNGTWVNGRRVADCVLQRGDRVQIGNWAFAFQSGESVPVTRHVSPAPGLAPDSAAIMAGIARGLKSYQITGTVGSGGAATVYKGISLIDRSQVAIKILHSTDPFIRQKFKEEGAVGYELRHPHIVRIYHYGEDGGRYYIVMEYVDGGSLRQRLVHGSPSPLDFVKSVIGQSCEALAYAHSRGVIHRDIKPENIMLSTRAGIKIVDFGIAKLTSAATKTSEGFLIGTPYYIPYEVPAGEQVTPSSDIYSLGVVLYEMATGEWPFTGATSEVIKKHLNDKPVPPRQINPALPPEIEAATMRALEKDQRRRYQNAMDLARDLGYQAGVPMEASPLDDLVTMPPALEVPLTSAQPPPPLPFDSSLRSSRPRLVVVAGGARGKGISLVQGSIGLGRAEIDVNDNGISRQHLEVTWQGSQIRIKDVGSTNGTFVNGNRIPAGNAILLHPGDMIRLGNTMLRFEA